LEAGPNLEVVTELAPAIVHSVRSTRARATGINADVAAGLNVNDALGNAVAVCVVAADEALINAARDGGHDRRVGTV